jgi:uncharacterized membrane protein YcaP (DUF421 family)
MGVPLAFGWLRIVFASTIGSLVVAAVFDHKFQPLGSLLVGATVGTVFWTVWALQYRRAVARNAQPEE